MRIAIAPFLPDQADLDTNVSQVVRNVQPGVNSYSPIKGPAAYSDALDADPRGLWLANTVAGDFVAFAATETTLEKLVGTGWTEIGSGLTGPGDGSWAGAQFGTEFFFNNITDGLQKFDIEGGSAISAVGGDSVAARHMDVVEEYLMCGNTEDSPRAVKWSATNDASTWSGSNSGGQTFPDGGGITAICGASGLIIQETIVRDIIFDPGNSIFSFAKREQAKGSISPESVVRFGDTIAYLAEDGFWWNGEPIGQNAVNNYFLGMVDQNQLYSVLGRVDSTRPLFWWHYRTGASDTLYDRALIYNWRINQWAEVELDLLYAAQSATTGFTLEQLSTIYPDIETVPYSFDSRVWLGGRPVYAVINEDRKLAFLDGDNLEATIETQEKEHILGYRTRIKGVRPLVDSSAAVVAIGTRERMGDTRSWGSEISQQASGLCPANSGARNHRYRVRIPAASTWTHIQGVDIPKEMMTRDGMR